MNVTNYLIKYQPILYRIFLNTWKNKKVSHAYLLSGEPGTPLKEVALFLAKTLVCDDPQPLACEKCLSCIRISDGTFSDLMVFDGQEKTIRKENVSEITFDFEKTAFEAKGVMIYILHLVENMTVEAVNSLLKFLEEPGKNVYAFLTTENESKILPTIISRSQVLNLKTINKDELIKESVELGASLEDAELLSRFFNDSTTLLENSQKQDYQDAKKALIKQLEAFLVSKNEAVFILQREVTPLLRTKETARFYLDMLTIVFEDLINVKLNNRLVLSTYDKMLKELASKLTHLDESLVMIMTSRGKIDLNVNISLLLDYVIFQIIKE
ncbi:MAG: hypothetical protein WCZ47_01840 [Bacilli bacterium]|jgi:DNA polymerase-3 subunit delta'|nr:hypothetical protein [Bacilli bacterium]NLN80352.1 hypothetical protein [Erysipelotrichia bacterium]